MRRLLAAAIGRSYSHPHVGAVAPVDVVFDNKAWVINYCRGKRVIHLGCAGAPDTQAEWEADTHLHKLLKPATAELWGVDVDARSIEWMTSQGADSLFEANVEEPMHRLFDINADIILAPELYEHLSNPGLFLEAIKPLIGHRTELLLTTPNAHTFSQLAHLLAGREGMNPDHVQWPSPRALASMLTRHGYELTGQWGYSHVDWRSFSLRRPVIWRRVLYAINPTGFADGIIVTARLAR